MKSFQREVTKYLFGFAGLQSHPVMWKKERKRHETYSDLVADLSVIVSQGSSSWSKKLVSTSTRKRLFFRLQIFYLNFLQYKMVRIFKMYGYNHVAIFTER